MSVSRKGNRIFGRFMMKIGFLNFLKRYYLLTALGLLHPLAMATTKYWGRIIIINTALGSFRTYEFYLIFFIPIFYFTYGCITYIVTKKMCIPHAILIVVFFAYFGIWYLKTFDFSIDKLLGMLFFAVFPIVFSVSGTLITAGLYKVIKLLKESDK